MSAMIERVARAIHAERCKVAAPCPKWEHYVSAGNREIAMALARAALEAMREPTEEMIAAGLLTVNNCTDNWSARAACIPEHVFPAMVEEALK